MSNTPDNPATAATVYRSLFQENLVGIRTTHFVSWSAPREGAVVVLTGAAW